MNLEVIMVIPFIFCTTDPIIEKNAVQSIKTESTLCSKRHIRNKLYHISALCKYTLCVVVVFSVFKVTASLYLSPPL